MSEGRVTDIDRAIQQAPKVLPPEMADWVVGTLTQARCGNRQYGKQFATDLAAEVLSLGESREDAIKKAKQVLAGDYNERHATSHKDAATAEEFTSEVAALASAGLLRSVDREPKPVESLSDFCTGSLSGDEAREYDAAVASCRGVDPVPEATREEIARTTSGCPEGDHWLPSDVHYEFADRLLSRYSIFPRHNPGESK